MFDFWFWIVTETVWFWSAGPERGAKTATEASVVLFCSNVPRMISRSRYAFPVITYALFDESRIDILPESASARILSVAIRVSPRNSRFFPESVTLP